MEQTWGEPGREERQLIDGQNQAYVIHGRSQTHVAYVRVNPPANRGLCYIYGKVSFDVGRRGSRCPVVLFSREKDNADRIDGDGYLTLCDDDESQRAIGEAHESDPFRVIMKLFEKREGKGSDVLIADIDHCQYGNGFELGRCFVVEGQMGFKIEVCYSVLLGARVEVGATLTKLEEGESTVSCQLVANQRFLAETLSPSLRQSGHLALTRTPLTKNPLTLGVLDVGKPLDLERRFVAAPMWDREYLQIGVGDAAVDFPLKGGFWNAPMDTLSCFTNKLTHTKTIKLISGAEISVSVNIVHPRLGKDARTSVKQDIKFPPLSLKKSHSWQHFEHGGRQGLN